MTNNLHKWVWQHKNHSLERFTALARGSGWTPLESWTDAAGMFSVHALVASD